MEEGRNIPLIIMLSAGSIISIACIVYEFSLFHTLLLVLATLVVFYLLGLIVKKIFLTINRDAEKRAKLLEQEEAEAQQKELAENEEVAARSSSVENASQDDDIMVD